MNAHRHRFSIQSTRRRSIGRRHWGTIVLLACVTGIAADMVASSDKETSAQPQPVELLGDPGFSRGFTVNSPVSGKHTPVGTICPVAGLGTPVWGLAQWACRNSLTSAVIRTQPDGWTVFADPGKSVAFLPLPVQGYRISFSMKGSVEYGGKSRQPFAPWIHLLAEQQIATKPKLGELEDLRFRIRFRLTKADPILPKEKQPPWHAAQFLCFLVVGDGNPASPGRNDYFWLGVPLYDSRYQHPRKHAALDKASGKFIYTPPGEIFTSVSAQGGDWLAVDHNLLPVIREGIAAARASGFLSRSRDEDLQVRALNLGWEVPGLLDVSAEFEGLSLQTVFTGRHPPNQTASPGTGGTTKASPLAGLISGSYSAALHSENADVIIYRATPGGIATAIAAEKLGSRVIIIEPTAHVGGMMVNGGLVVSDVGDYKNVGGVAREFFDRVHAFYVAEYGKESSQAKMSVLWENRGVRFEPRVGELVFQQMLAAHPRIVVRLQEELAAVARNGRRITGLSTVSTAKDCGSAKKDYRGKVFVDASYTGDLLATAGVSFALGRESRDQFNESLASTTPSNHHIQASNYRMTITDVPTNRVPIAKPENYDPESYRWWLDTIIGDSPPKLWGEFFHDWWRIPNGKMDANVADRPGVNYDYPQGTPERRRAIEKLHREYSLGFLYLLQNDLRVPRAIRNEASEWGLPKDEFADNGHFPREMYLREGRRLIGEYIVTQHDAQRDKSKPDSIGLATYAIDAHATDLWVAPDGTMHKSGFIYEDITPYEITYRALTPKRAESENLLVPVCVSATHVGFCSLRLEPTYMIMGHAAGIAARLASMKSQPVQDVDVAELRSRLQEQKAILNLPPNPQGAAESPELGTGFIRSPITPGLGKEVESPPNQTASPGTGGTPKAGSLTTLSQKLLRGRTVQCDFGFPYYQNRSAASIADEIEVNGYSGVYYFVCADNATRKDVIVELQKRGIPVAAMVIASGAYLPASERPKGWEKWRMEFTNDLLDSYQFMSYVHKDYAVWTKRRLVKLINDYGFDGLTFAEAIYPIADGLQRTDVLYGDISPAFQEAFKQETGCKVFPEFVNHDAPNYYKKIPVVYQALVNYRVKTVNDFYDEVINGQGGVREKCPGRFVATWTLGINLADGVAKLREWEGNDIPSMIRQVKPDMHFIQTHAPDWITPALKADYPNGYKPFFDLVKKTDPTMPVGFQGDFVSHVAIRRNPEWVRQWYETCASLPIDSTTYYEFSLRWRVYQEAPELVRIRKKKHNCVVLSFDQRLANDSALSVSGKAIIMDEAGRSFVVERAEVDGNLLALVLDADPVAGKQLTVRLEGIHTDPVCRFERKGPVQPMPKGKSNSVKDGVTVTLPVEMSP